MTFAETLNKNIRKKITELKGDGTVGMSIGNLRMITQTPSPSLAGAPAGPAGYTQVFANVVEKIKVKGFNIYE